MDTKQNVGTADRCARGVVGVALFALQAVLVLPFVVEAVFLVFGLVLTLTAIYGYCGLYVPLHIDTRRQHVT